MQQAKETAEGVGGANVEAEAETVIAEVTGINTDVGHAQVALDAIATITATAGATTLTLRIRRESVTGTEVAKVEVSAVKSAKQQVGIQATDVRQETSAGAKYVLTLTSAAAEKQKSVSSRINATY